MATAKVISMNYKGLFPFRLGCTSYVLPDAIIPNIEFMADKIDDAELVLFESKGFSNLLSDKEIIRLEHLGRENNVTFSVHFPIDIKAGAEDEAECEEFSRRAVGIIQSASLLPVSGYVLHLEGVDQNPAPESIARWRSRVDGVCSRIADAVSDPALVCVENLGYPPLLHSEFVRKYRFSNCVDCGHLWINGYEWEPYLRSLLDNTRIVHLHGVCAGKDHQSLAKHENTGQLLRLLEILENYTEVLTLEVFGKEDTFESLSYIGELWRRLH